MSFGESPSDIIIVVAFCRELYRKCRAAGGEYDETSREVRGLYTVFKHLKSEVKDGNSPLSRNWSIWDALRAYIRQMEHDGLLAGKPPTPQIPSPVSPHPERWINLTRSESSHAQPVSFNSIGNDDRGTREMKQREENVKLPTSIKLERLKPEPHLDSWFEGQSERQPTSIRRQLSPRLTHRTSAAQLTKPEWQLDTCGSESDTSSIHRHQTKSPPNIIQTSDLSLSPVLATPQLLPPPSPSTHHSQSHPNEATRSMAPRPNRSSDRATSKRTRRVRFDLSESQPSPKMNTPVNETSPRHDSTTPVATLGSDSYGNEISPGVIWTKVKRYFISPEVLNQDGRRYVVRPDFVAIYGALTKEELQNYASRSYALREERWRKHHQAAMGPKEASSKEKLPGARRRRNSSSSESSSGENSTSASDSDSDSGWNSDSESESDSNSNSESDSNSDSNSDSDSDDDSHKKKGKGKEEKGSNVKNREDRRERGERGDGDARAERRESIPAFLNLAKHISIFSTK
ncbi:hypothetical protein SS1G_00824 [Sclerotinia sclerotiorum 1980 UF-70]|uniref:DUF8035 domain-containing protein n=1 Tax=Sclerotinia sclerotiorum (strain ATCC 18683 / 1980 / Ss-1) TaxID=665079 RepID=A7E699_SCLS1|nr:hypothetical protein SS1G_00824 [Sclerotinia sclerotiorum 1980 UF-70]EDN91421.1 hypothetical protein SS1G_00824 [Sclerotinia sclerotiorum 1980 UF-70]